jgi:uncharacterized protein (DUF433 family)
VSRRGALKKSRGVLRGSPLFRGTRIPQSTLFDYLKGGKTLVDFLRDFPPVSREQAMEMLDRAASQDKAGLFERKSDLNQLAREQDVSAVVDFESLLGNFWPEDESADDFITQLRSWRKQDRTGRGV